MENSNKLYRSNTEKIIGGVSGGLADYLNIDVVIIRIIFVLLALFGGGGVLIYIILWIAIPAQSIYNNTMKRMTDSETVLDEEATQVKQPNKQSNTALGAGIALIIVGLLFLADRLMPFYNLIDFWPVILIAVGVIIIKPDLFKSSKKLES
ncbi:MAG: PspC domain-containing protein [Bacteroidales bacterium]|jgi:phage shock protein C|nr:PspC domain-containing protein [Bacteroidales bacterium]